MVRRLERLTARGGSAATERTAGGFCHSFLFRSHHLPLVTRLTALGEHAFRLIQRESEEADGFARREYVFWHMRLGRPYTLTWGGYRRQLSLVVGNAVV